MPELSREHIRKQVSRLVSLPSQQTEAFGVDPQQIRDDLGKAIERYARSDTEATAIVDALIFDRPADKRSWRPTPGDVATAAEEVKRKREDSSGKAPTGCPECSGSGRVVIERTVFNRASHSEELTSAVDFCKCAKGQWLAAKDAERRRSEVA